MISITTGIIIVSIVFVTYVTWVVNKYGVLPSISHSYYKHYEKWMFLAFMWGMGLPIVLMAEAGYLFFSGAFLMFCGIAPAFSKKEDKIRGDNHDRLESKIHSIGAEGGIGLALASLVLTYGVWWVLPVFLIPTIYMYIKKTKNHTFWIEVLAVITIVLGFITK